jgi:chaperonin GroES
MKLEKKLSLEKLQDSENINELLSEEESNTLGNDIIDWFRADDASRQKWKDKMEEATKLALQVTEPKSYPWPKASNVKFPLITIASTQFAARSYPALVKSPDLVKFRVQGRDDGTKAARASRISQHMSYQLLEEDERWEEDMDKALLALPILGCVFKKSYYDKTKGHNCSNLVLPKQLVVHYYAKSIEDAERKTEVYSMSERKIRERQLRGIFSEAELGPVAGWQEPEEADERQGTSPPFSANNDAPRTLLECHCYLDLDGDGYKEPYVVTVDKDSAKVLRVVSRFKSVTTEQAVKIEELQKRMRAFAEGLPQLEQGQQASPEQLELMRRAEATITEMQAQVQKLAEEKPTVLKIDPIEYYTKYSFIPAPDGGFYDLGFGALLGPLNNSVNTLINQLIDSGSLQNQAGGFIGRGARMKGGKFRFSPHEWKRVNVAGGTLRDSIVPLPVNEPSPVLFNLLSLLISYTERTSSVNDAMVGENPGQNTPAYNMSAMLEQGMQVFNGIFKRVYRSMRSEFRKLYALNAVYLDQEQYFEYQDSDVEALRTDYTADPKDLIPAADPNAFSNKEKVEKAMMIKQNAQMTPGYDPIQVELKWLEAMDIPDAKQLFPLQMNQETGQQEYVYPPQPNPELELKKAELQSKVQENMARAEKDFALADSQIGLNEIETKKTEAEIEAIYANIKRDMGSVELDRMKLTLEESARKREEGRQQMVDTFKGMLDAASAELTLAQRDLAKANAQAVLREDVDDSSRLERETDAKIKEAEAKVENISADTEKTRQEIENLKTEKRATEVEIKAAESGINEMLSDDGPEG